MQLLHISKHASERIYERTGLSAYQIAKIINKKQYIKLSGKPGLAQKEYLLFYDQENKTYFVIYRDTIDGTLITVLLLEQYEKNILTIVTDTQKQAAYQLITIQKTECQKPSRIHLTASYRNSDGNLKTKKMKKFDLCKHCKDDIALFISSHLDIFELKLLASEQSIEYTAIAWFSVRLGEKGEPTILYPPEQSESVMTH